MRGLDLRLCVSMGSRAHTGFIGEQAALYALADRLLNRIAEAAADDSGRIEGILENEAEGFGDILDAAYENDKSADNIDDSHDGDYLFRDRGNALDAANEYYGGDSRDHQTDDPCGDAEGGVAGFTDGVRLHHCAHEAERKDDCNREEAGHERAELMVESML